MGLSLFLSRLFRFFFLSLFSREEEEQHTRLMAAAAYSLAQPSAGPVTERASWSPCVTSWRRKRGKRDGRARFSVPAPPSNRLLTNESSYLFLSTSLYISSLSHSNVFDFWKKGNFRAAAFTLFRISITIHCVTALSKTRQNK